MRFGDRGLEEIVMRAGGQRGAVEEGHLFVQDRRIAGYRDIVRDAIAQPDAIIRNPRAHALAGMGQPPMLHIAFGKLPGRRRADRCARVISGRSAVSAMPSCNWSRKP